MVKFGVNYAANIDLEHANYVDYDQLKKKVHEMEAALQQSDDCSAFSAAESHKAFINLFFAELERVDHIYKNSMGMLLKEYFEIKHLEHLVHNTKKQKLPGSQASNARAAAKRKALVKKREEALKRALTTTYRKSLGLESANTLNRVAAIKIMKKHDKISKRAGRKPFFKDTLSVLKVYSFDNGTDLKELQNNLEDVYTDAFCDGLREEAQGKLRLSKGGINESAKTWIAFKGGVLLTVCVWLLFQLIFSPKVTMTYITMEDPSIVVYAVVAGLLTFRWIWAFAVYMWEWKQIDYILLLDLDAAKHAQPAQQIASNAFTYSILFASNLLIFHCVRMLELYINPANRFAGLLGWFADHVYIMPMSLLVGTGLALLRTYLQPTSYGVFSTQIFIQLFQIPFTDVQLRHTFAADILSSFTKVMRAAALSACYFSSGAFYLAGDSASSFGANRYATCSNSTMHAFITTIYVLPLVMRVMQNVRQQYDSNRRIAVEKAAADKDPTHHGVTAAAVAAGGSGGGGVGSDSAAVEGELRSKALGRLSRRGSAAAASDDVHEYEAEDSRVDASSSNNNRNSPQRHAHAHAHNRVVMPAAESSSDELSTRIPSVSKSKPGSGESQREVAELAGDSNITESSENNEIIDLETGTAAAAATTTTAAGTGVRNQFSEVDTMTDGGESKGDENKQEEKEEGYDDDDDDEEEEDSSEEADRFDVENNVAVGVNKVAPRSTSFAVDIENAKAAVVAAAPIGLLNNNSVNDALPRLSHSESAYFYHEKLGIQDILSVSWHQTQHHQQQSGDTSSISSNNKDRRETRLVKGEERPNKGLTALLGMCLPKWLIVWPYSYNMLRYILSILVVVFGAYIPQGLSALSPLYMAWYIPLVVCSTIYNIYWDIVVDWDLLDTNAELFLLRESNRLYFKDQAWMYYLFMGLNVVFRCMWTLHFTPYGSHPFLGLFELVRRGLWACLRMEVAYIRELRSRSKLD